MAAPTSEKTTLALEAAVLRCLAKDPSKRFPGADSLERALAGCACAAT